ncbi:lasso RiPP family leader peptide-containing protein [Dyadobacter sp. CY326]|uniref:lasso RiPP family leader peptide-containing protein n=1 Tax=Dyadobacter sp. CY326 TaxID=2907300 RepID=UPI001F27D565|nr:lasso RiPP family leader peptide-containing protein [Dyadobacter sp. CY326]
MKTVNSHSTQTKKSYRKPVLNKFGNVAKLTKGKQGSLFDDLTSELTYSPDA